MKSKWIACCEYCHYRPIVSASNEREAIKRSEEIHQQEKGDYCNGLILVAFPLETVKAP